VVVIAGAVLIETVVPDLHGPGTHGGITVVAVAVVVCVALGDLTAVQPTSVGAVAITVAVWKDRQLAVCAVLVDQAVTVFVESRAGLARTGEDRRICVVTVARSSRPGAYAVAEIDHICRCGLVVHPHPVPVGIRVAALGIHRPFFVDGTVAVVVTTVAEFGCTSVDRSDVWRTVGGVRIAVSIAIGPRSRCVRSPSSAASQEQRQMERGASGHGPSYRLSLLHWSDNETLLPANRVRLLHDRRE